MQAHPPGGCGPRPPPLLPAALLASLALFALPASAALVESDFSPSDGTDWQVVAGRWENTDESWRATADVGAARAVTGGEWSEVVLQAYVKVEQLESEDSKAGVMFRYVDDCNHYELSVSPQSGGQLQLSAVVDCIRHRLPSIPVPLDRGWHRYRLQVLNAPDGGINVTVQRDFSTVIEYSGLVPQAPASGRVGLFVESAQRGVARFDNVVVRWPYPAFGAVLWEFARNALKNWADNFQWGPLQGNDPVLENGRPPRIFSENLPLDFGGFIPLPQIPSPWSFDPSLHLFPPLQILVILGALSVVIQIHRQKRPAMDLSGPGFGVLSRVPRRTNMLLVAAGLIAAGGVLPPLLPPCSMGGALCLAYHAFRR